MSLTETLSIADRHAKNLVRSGRTRFSKAESSPGTAQFSRWAVPPDRSKTDPAQWIVNRTEFVRNYKNSVYIGVGAIARKMAMQGAQVFRRSVKKSGVTLTPVKPSHPLQVLFREVNPRDTEWDLWFYTEGWKMLTGDAFWWKARNGLGAVKEIWPIPSQWVWAIPSEEEYIRGYKVEGVFRKDNLPGGGTFVPSKDMVHIREPNMDWSGNGRFYGSPPILAAANTIDIESAMFTRLYHSFKNYAPPGQIFATDTPMTEALLKQLYNQIVNMHSQAEKYGAPMILHSGLKPQFPGGGGTMVRELDYRQSLDATLTLTLAILGVPKAVVGITEDVNRANMLGAITAFCESTINPRLVQNGQALTYGIARDFAPDGSLVVKFPPCTVDDAEAMRKAVETAAKFGSITPNEIRDVLLDRDEFLVGGNRPLANAGMVEQMFGNDESVKDDDQFQAPPPGARVVPPQMAPAKPAKTPVDDIDAAEGEVERESKQRAKQVAKSRLAMTNGQH